MVSAERFVLTFEKRDRTPHSRSDLERKMKFKQSLTQSHQMLDEVRILQFRSTDIQRMNRSTAMTKRYDFMLNLQSRLTEYSPLPLNWISN